ncbi:MAG: hypothetical protein Q4A64_03435 [Porphyromonadaceae bacterium]|nr:hypothetical protein [Porphyromonadaceae bacterium]
METKVISAFDANNGFCSGDLFTDCGLQVIIKSPEAVEVAKVAYRDNLQYATEDWIDEQVSKLYVGVSLAYDSQHTSQSGIISIDHDSIDAIRAALELEFGKPETANAPIEYLGYDEAHNDHWAVWSLEVEVNDDNDIISWVEY